MNFFDILMTALTALLALSGMRTMEKGMTNELATASGGEGSDYASFFEPRRAKTCAYCRNPWEGHRCRSCGASATHG